MLLFINPHSSSDPPESALHTNGAVSPRRYRGVQRAAVIQHVSVVPMTRDVAEVVAVGRPRCW